MRREMLLTCRCGSWVGPSEVGYCDWGLGSLVLVLFKSEYGSFVRYLFDV